jgi:excisionase family DNA binding protein
MKTKLLTVAEAAQLKQVPRATIYSAIAHKRLAHQRVLGKLALREADVLAWTPRPHAGRGKGNAMSEEAKARISASQKKRWAAKKQNSQ